MLHGPSFARLVTVYGRQADAGALGAVGLVSKAFTLLSDLYRWYVVGTEVNLFLPETRVPLERPIRTTQLRRNWRPLGESNPCCWDENPES